MTVKEFIEFLVTQDPDLPVAYRCCSEQVLLNTSDIRVDEFCVPRPDGWIEDKRPDKPYQKYLLLPGN